MEKRIFMSHSSKDHETASVICDALEKNGLKKLDRTKDGMLGF